MKNRLVSISLVTVILAIIALIVTLALQESVENSAPPVVTLTDKDRTEAERIIRARINSLSPTPPKLGGRFDVRGIEWDGRGVATVRYDDGESMLKGSVRILTGSGRVKIEGFEMKE